MNKTENKIKSVYEFVKIAKTVDLQVNKQIVGKVAMKNINNLCSVLEEKYPQFNPRDVATHGHYDGAAKREFVSGIMETLGNKFTVNEASAITSTYYEREFSPEEIEDAFKLYVEWCKKNKQNPEVSSVEEIDQSNIDHILYHAEIEGFKIEEGATGDPYPKPGKGEVLSGYPKELWSGIKFWKAYGGFESLYSTYNSYSPHNEHHKNKNFLAELSVAVDSGDIDKIIDVVQTENVYDLGKDTIDKDHVKRALKIGVYESEPFSFESYRKVQEEKMNKGDINEAIIGDKFVAKSDIEIEDNDGKKINIKSGDKIKILDIYGTDFTHKITVNKKDRYTISRDAFNKIEIDKINEAVKYDVEAVVKDIKEFNKGNMKLDDLIISAIANLGVKDTPLNRKVIKDHFGASSGGDGKVPEDEVVVKELFDMLESKQVISEKGIEILEYQVFDNVNMSYWVSLLHAGVVHSYEHYGDGEDYLLTEAGNILSRNDNEYNHIVPVIKENIESWMEKYGNEYKQGMIMETGEWTGDEEDQVWMGSLKDMVKDVEKRTNGRLKLIDVKGFDKYVGPYALCKINGKEYKIWTIVPDHHMQIPSVWDYELWIEDFPIDNTSDGGNKPGYQGDPEEITNVILGKTK